MTTVLYIYQREFPWDVRVEKVCSALKDAGARVVILSRWKEGLQEREVFKGMEIVRVGKGYPGAFSVPLSYSPLWVKVLKDLIEEIKPDLIIPREIMLAESAARLARKKNIPVVMDMAEHYPAAMRGWKKYSRNLALRLLVHTLRVPDIVEKRSVRLCDGIITVCREQNERLHQDYNYPEESMQVVHNTPELGWFSQVKKGSSHPPKVFAHHGFITPERGLENFIRGFSLAAEKLPDIELILAGDGESMDDVKREAALSPARNRIHLTGTYKHEELVELYSQTDVGVIPHHADEFRNHTLPNKLFDYMACGKPVITSLAKPLQRIVKEENIGYAVDCTIPEEIAKAIVSLCTADTEQFSENGLHAAQSRYNWDNDTAQMIRFLKQYSVFG